MRRGHDGHRDGRVDLIASDRPQFRAPQRRCSDEEFETSLEPAIPPRNDVSQYTRMRNASRLGRFRRTSALRT